MTLKQLDKYIHMIDDFKKQHILVIGDIMLDEYVWGNATRISPEAPVPVVEIKNRTYHPGGAANTVSNILSLGANATLLGVTGNDAAGKKLKSILDKNGIVTKHIITDTSRPTTTKMRIIAHSQQVMRADHEESSHVSQPINKRMIKSIDSLIEKISGIAVSDYNKGVINPGFMAHLLTVAKEAGKIITADIKPSNAHLFKGVTIITPNRSEAQQMTGVKIKDESSLFSAGDKLQEMFAAKAILITLGEDGMALFKDGKMDMIPAVSTQVYDVTGAGDTVLSVITVSLAAGHRFMDAVKLSNYAAGYVVRQMGTTAVDKEELKKFIKGNL